MSKYLFYDIDGTLIGASRKVSQKTVEGIRQARKNGHKTFLCTGRAPISIMKSIKDIGFDGIISSAGGFISIGDKYIFENFIDQYLLLEVILLFSNARILFSLETKDALYQTPGVQEFFDQKNNSILKENLELARFFKERKNEEIKLSIRKFNIKKNKVTKICFISEDKLAFYDCVKYLNEFFNIVIFSKETDDFINGEIILKNCTKGDAIKRVTEYFKAKIEDTIAFGDSMNDYQMIEAAGYGIVSYLAPEKLKAIADDTFEDPDNDGIYKCMKQLELI